MYFASRVVAGGNAARCGRKSHCHGFATAGQRCFRIPPEAENRLQREGRGRCRIGRYDQETCPLESLGSGQSALCLRFHLGSSIPDAEPRPRYC